MLKDEFEIKKKTSIKKTKHYTIEMINALCDGA